MCQLNPEQYLDLESKGVKRVTAQFYAEASPIELSGI